MLFQIFSSLPILAFVVGLGDEGIQDTPIKLCDVGRRNSDFTTTSSTVGDDVIEASNHHRLGGKD